MKSGAELLTYWGDTIGNLLHCPTGERQQWLRAHDGSIEAIAAARDGRTLITGGRNGVIRLWAVSALRRPSAIHSYNRVLRLPPDARHPERVAITRAWGSLSVLDAATGEVVLEVPGREERHCRDIAGAPEDLGAIYALYNDNLVHVWRADGIEPRREFRLDSDEDYHDLAAARPNSPVLIAGDGRGRVGAFHARTGGALFPAFVAHADSHFDLVAEAGPDALRFVTAAAIGTPSAIQWTVQDGKVTAQPLPINDGSGPEPKLPIFHTTYWTSVHGRRLILGAGADSLVHIWDAATGELLAHDILRGAPYSTFNAISAARIGGRDYLLGGGHSCTLSFWSLEPDPTTGQRIEYHIWLGAQLWSITPLAGERIAVAGPRGLLVLKVEPDFFAAEAK